MIARSQTWSAEETLPRQPSPAVPANWTQRHVWAKPQPLQPAPLTRLVVRSVISTMKNRVVELSGLEHISPECDPLIFVSNHNHRMEALLLPALLIHSRNGKLIHFMADWPTMLVPLAGLILRQGQVIPITRKSPRLKFLNFLKPLYKKQGTALEQAQAKLRSGGAVGIFPEATVNRDPVRLLRGQSGAAHLALLSGVPVVPAGVRFPGHDPQQPIKDSDPMAIEIGPPISPPETAGEAKPSRRSILDFHTTIMSEISRLSGKEWHPRTQRRRHHVT